jgi:LmbE family N-acetylglucosaminyl deacetylase
VTTESVSSKNNVLVIAAHPDDEVLGVGATVNKHIENGDMVTFVYITDGYMQDYSDEGFRKEKRECARKASYILGVDKLYFLGFHGLLLDTISKSKLNMALTRLVENVKPDIVYTHYWGDVNHDHQIVFDMTVVACRPHRDKAVKKILAYEVLSSTEWSGKVADINYQPTEFNIVSKKNLIDKIEAFKCYHTEQFEYPHPRAVESIETLAKHRGFSINREYAEAFLVIRNICE